MSDSRPILKVGLTGGIASGKSTVAGFLAEFGAFTIDGDAVAHQVMDAGGSAHDDVVARFGREFLDDDGRINRPALARLVFSDPRAREDLNAIVHSRVLDEVERRIDEQRESGHAALAVLDAALLVESGAYRSLHRLIVARCSQESQIQRLISRDGLSAQEALARIESQAPLADKLAVADYVIDTDTTLRETRLQTIKVHTSLLSDLEQELGKPGSGLTS